MRERYLKKTVVINRAVPGSGKTTISNCIVRYLNARNLSFAVHSTDDYFMDDKGRYIFDVEKLSLFHRANLSNFKKSLQAGIDVVVCDNINLSPWQTVPYTNAAREFGYQIVFVTFMPRELEKHVQSQKVTQEKPDAHGVPEEVLVRFIKEHETYDELLDKNVPIDPERHKNYEWDMESNNRVELEHPSPHFDLDWKIVIQPDEYHDFQKSIGLEIYRLMERQSE